MITDTQRRSQIFRRISRVPANKLKELDEFVSQLEKDTDKRSINLNFAGAWQDIDDSVFDSFTKDLINNRQSNRKRIDD